MSHVSFYCLTTCEERYELEVPPEDKTRVAAMDSTELQYYTSQRRDNWQFVKLSTLESESPPDDCEVLS